MQKENQVNDNCEISYQLLIINYNDCQLGGCEYCGEIWTPLFTEQMNISEINIIVSPNREQIEPREYSLGKQ